MKKSILIISILLVICPLFASGAKKESSQTIAVTATEQDYKIIRARWVSFLTDVDEKARESYTQAAQKWVQSFNAQTNDFLLWDDLTDFESGAQIQSAYDRLKMVARVYMMGGNPGYKSAEYLAVIKSGLEFLYTRAYNEKKLEKGNWWQWEIGIPKILNDTLTLAYDDLEPEKIRQYVGASRFFQPDPLFNGSSAAARVSSSPQKRDSTGANLVDTVSISFLRGVLVQDPNEVIAAVNALDGINTYVAFGEGFYVDGSFIQHYLPYSGTYAAVLYNGLGTLLYMADGTAFDGIKSKMTVVYESMLESFPWLFVNGGINDSLSGRSIARDDTSDVERGRALVTSFALLFQAAPEQYRMPLAALIKTAIRGNGLYFIPDRVANNTQKNILLQIACDDTINAQEPTGGKVFWGMDRVVYKAPSGGTFVVAMHSNRVGNFEIMNGENLKGWHTGDGMSYIYGKDSRAYTDFWPTVDPYHLAGTTESTAERPAKPTGERRHPQTMTPAVLVGGVASEKSLLAVMDFYSWNDKTQAKKSWFFADNLMIALGSGITSSDGGEIHTTIDNRIIRDTVQLVPSSVAENDVFEIQDGNDVFSYKLLSGSADLNLSERSGSWKSIGGTSAQMLKNRYFTAVINHGKNPQNAKYAYIAAPLADADELENLSQKLDILRLDEKAHCVRFENITAVNFFADERCTVDKFTVTQNFSLIAEETNDGMILFVSDPGQIIDEPLYITVAGAYTSEADKKSVSVSTGKTSTRIVVKTPSAQTIKIVLKKTQDTK